MQGGGNNKTTRVQMYGVSRDDYSQGPESAPSIPMAIYSNGAVPVSIVSQFEATPVQNEFLYFDDVTLFKLGMYTLSVNYAVNPANSGDRWRNNGRESVLTSSSRTVQTDSADLVNYNWRGVHLIINITGYTTGGLTAVIQGKDLVSGEYYDIARSNVYTSTGVKVLVLGPGVEPKAGTGFADMLPRDWRVRMEVDTGDSITYSVGANLMV